MQILEDLRLTGIHIMPYQNEKETEILQIAGALIQKGSPHPLKDALNKVLATNAITPQAVEYFKEVSPLGWGGIVDNRAVIMGSLDFMKQSSLTLPPALKIESNRQKAQGRRLVYLGWEGEVRAMLILESQPKAQQRSLALWIAISAAAGLALLSLLMGSCNRIATQRAIRGTLTLGNDNYRYVAIKPNAVCYLIVKDQWGTPVAIRRWLNPKFPLYFRITADDRLVASRPWKGPYHLHAYLFESNNTERELPPPVNAARAVSDHPVYPAVTGNSQLILQ